MSTPDPSSPSDHRSLHRLIRSASSDSIPTISSVVRSASDFPPAIASIPDERSSSTHQACFSGKPSASTSETDKHGVSQGVLETPSPRSLTSSPKVTPVDPNVGTAASSTSGGHRFGEDFEEVLRHMDENGDGKISPAELRRCMKAVGNELSAEDAEALVKSMDTDGDGLLEFDDLVKLVDEGGEEERVRDLREAFDMYVGERERITPPSLHRALQQLGNSKTIEECMVMIQKFDLDGDGELSFEEFKTMML